uniref:Uncharacterized protein n=1 Tax=Oryza glumipatula TaxID=40148 RepID=A0A0D9YRS4_9ORYZ
MKNFLEKEASMGRPRPRSAPGKLGAQAKKPMTPAAKKPQATPKTKKRRITRLFKKGSSSQSSCHQDELSTHSSVNVLIEDADIPPRLFSDSDLDLVGDREMQAYHMLKDRFFAHTRAYDPELLRKIGMNLDFRKVWKAVVKVH